MSNVTIDEVKGKLLTLDQVNFEIAKTEPISSEYLSGDTKILFKFDDDWAHGTDSLKGTSPVQGLMRINGVDHQLTKDAALQAGANYGLSGALMKKLPTNLLEANLNYFYSLDNKEFNALIVKDRVNAFTRPTLTPFLNTRLVENVLDGIRARYGDTEVFADYKFHNSIQRTDIRFIVPADQRVILDTNMADTPSGEFDRWSAGVHLSNSLTGKSQTSVDAYLFRWWCTNGATSINTEVGTWSRRSNGMEPDDAYAWARESVDAVLGGLEEKFAQIQSMAHINVANNTAEVVHEIFGRYGIPIQQRGVITDNLLDTEDLSLYSIMNAVNQAANADGLDPARVDLLMRAAGDIPTAVFSTSKELVWNEGHTAPENAHNPYTLG